MIEGLGLKTITFQPFRDFEGMPEPQRVEGFRASRAQVRRDAGARLRSPHGLQQRVAGLRLAASTVRRRTSTNSASERRRRGMRVGFEALAWGRHVHDYRDAWEVVRRADHPAVGLVLDSFHMLARGTDLRRSAPYRRTGSSWCRWRTRQSSRWIICPGAGTTAVFRGRASCRSASSWRAARHRLRRSLSLEIFNDRFRAGSARSVAVDGQRSLIVMLDELRRETGVAIRGQPNLPPQGRLLRRRIHRIRSRRALRRRVRTDCLAARLPKGRHPSLKSGDPVASGRHQRRRQRRQGRLRPLVQHHARAIGLRHGAACRGCAATTDRAMELLDQPFRQAVGPGELNIPAVRGLGGSLLYFVDHKSGLDRLWDIDFEPVAGDGWRGCAGLTRIDHVSQSMQYEEMLTWLLFYTSLLDVAEDIPPDRDRPRRCGAKPGGRNRRRIVAAGPQRLSKPADSVVALPRRTVRLRRTAHRLRNR